jgi:hypothetical protein
VCRCNEAQSIRGRFFGFGCAAGEVEVESIVDR